MLKEEGSPVGRPPAGALGGGVRRENSLLERERCDFLIKMHTFSNPFGKNLSSGKNQINAQRCSSRMLVPALRGIGKTEPAKHTSISRRQ